MDIREYRANDFESRGEERMATSTVLSDAELKAHLGPRAAFDDLLKRRFFFGPSFEIYGGSAGLIDLGPAGCSLKTHLESEWRQHYIIHEEMLEVQCTTLTPEPVFKASGHVAKFSDHLVKDVANGDCYRADVLLQDFLTRELEKDNLTQAKRDEYQCLHTVADTLTVDELGEAIHRLRIRAPQTGNELSDPYPFNLMFGTSIGPSGQMPGYLRPETAQGIFTNFKRLLEYNGGGPPLPPAPAASPASDTGPLEWRGHSIPPRECLRLRHCNDTNSLVPLDAFHDREDKTLYSLGIGSYSHQNVILEIKDSSDEPWVPYDPTKMMFRVRKLRDDADEFEPPAEVYLPRTGATIGALRTKVAEVFEAPRTHVLITKLYARSDAYVYSKDYETVYPEGGLFSIEILKDPIPPSAASTPTVVGMWAGSTYGLPNGVQSRLYELQRRWKTQLTLRFNEIPLTGYENMKTMNRTMKPKAPILFNKDVHVESSIPVTELKVRIISLLSSEVADPSQIHLRRFHTYSNEIGYPVRTETGTLTAAGLYDNDRVVVCWGSVRPLDVYTVQFFLCDAPPDPLPPRPAAPVEGAEGSGTPADTLSPLSEDDDEDDAPGEAPTLDGVEFSLVGKIEIQADRPVAETKQMLAERTGVAPDRMRIRIRSWTSPMSQLGRVIDRDTSTFRYALSDSIPLVVERLPGPERPLTHTETLVHERRWDPVKQRLGKRYDMVVHYDSSRGEYAVCLAERHGIDAENIAFWTEKNFYLSEVHIAEKWDRPTPTDSPAATATGTATPTPAPTLPDAAPIAAAPADEGAVDMTLVTPDAPSEGLEAMLTEEDPGAGIVPYHDVPYPHDPPPYHAPGAAAPAPAAPLLPVVTRAPIYLRWNPAEGDVIVWKDRRVADREYDDTAQRRSRKRPSKPAARPVEHALRIDYGADDDAPQAGDAAVPGAPAE
eukprot:gnl/Trimastix_PCT/1335.p1 GENE.gnl/Trimastix_PCT/1335~~gnl/Trimastix_PCT/1335.p1  ORF type:complete len:944 (+),score=327.43 gnl/Trimastix_PCT/1335:78-2909(+)